MAHLACELEGVEAGLNLGDKDLGAHLGRSWLSILPQNKENMRKRQVSMQPRILECRLATRDII